MFLKKRETLIFILITFSLVFIVASIFQVRTDLFIPLEAKEISSDNLDERDIEKLPVDIKDIENESFIRTINGKNYLAEYITQEDVEEMKTQSDPRNFSKDYNQIIDDHGTGLAPPTEEAYNKLVGKISIKEVISENIKSSAIAASIDLSSEIYFPTIGDQKQQGSCTSWANAYYAYGYMEAKDYGWNAQSGNPEYLLSPAWTYNKLANNSMMGSNPIQTAKLMTEWGVATLKTMPYNDADASSWGDEPAWREAPYHRPLDYTLITYEGDPTINAIKSLLNSKIPVTFAINAFQYGRGLNDITGDYILSSGEYSSLTLNHANCFVGYDDSITEGSDVGAFRVVNSWGDDWMDDGFYWLTYEAFKKCGNVSWQELIFYEDRIHYEPSLIATWEFSSAPIRMSDIITLGVGSHDAPLDTITPHYGCDGFYLFPLFMALDISEFQSYYNSNNNVNFYLEIGQSRKSGTISSFLVERYVSGELQEITQYSFNIPKTTPGYINALFFLYVKSSIFIDDSDPNYNWEWASMQDWCDGSGTKDVPYVIQGLIIDGGGSGSCITIKNSNAYFRIENCKIYNSGFGEYDAGIRLINTRNGELINNDCSYNNQYGIYLDNSDNNIISENYANYNERYGISLSDSNDNTVLENPVKSNDYGIYLVNSNNNLFYQNYFLNNSLNAQDSGTNTKWDNNLIGNYWDDYTGIDEDNNNIGDTPYNKNGVIDNYPIFWNDGQYGRKLYIDDHAWNNWELVGFLPWFSGSGTENEPYVIQDFIIDAGGSGSCILIENSIAYFRIENCTVYNSGTEVSDAGIKLIKTNNGEIINNNCSDNTRGIYLDKSNNYIISGNIVNNNDNGIFIAECNYNTISGNEVKYNDIGIIMGYTFNNIVRGNKVFHNEKYGIYLAVCRSSTILGNIIYNNDIGIHLYGPFTNLFYQNIFINNGLHAQNQGISARWDNGTIGNYWDDYTGIDANDDNIGDTPYVSEIDNIDNYPIYRYHENPIYIDDNAENNWEWAKKQIWCNGSGTADEPYIIQDLIIDGGGSLFGSCISIKNSNVYFRIENCKVYNSGFGGYDAAIRLINTRNGEIINNDVSQNPYGIWLRNSHENVLCKNILSENLRSLILDSSENIVTENTFSDNNIGIMIVGTSSYNTFHSNFFYRSSYSHVYFLYYSYSGSGNSWDNGVVGNYWDDYTGVDYDDNGIGDTPYVIDIDNIDNYPLWEDGPIYIDELGGRDYTWEEANARYWCSGSGTEEDPYVIKDLIIDCGGSGIGIRIENSNAYFRIENCIVYNSGAGICLVSTNNGKIINNDCSDNNMYGIYLNNSDNNIISGNTANSNLMGIKLYNCDYNTISGNTVNNNYIGILLYNCDNIIISENTANNNNAGIFLDGSDDNTISKNTVNYNVYLGIQFKNSYSNEVSENTASYNGNYGIFLEGSMDNYGTGNYLLSNGLGPIYFDVNSGPVDWIEYIE